MRAGDLHDRIARLLVRSHDIQLAIAPSNEAGLSPTLIPSTGIVLDKLGAGQWTSDCLFVNPVLEGITNGSWYRHRPPRNSRMHV